MQEAAHRNCRDPACERLVLHGSSSLRTAFVCAAAAIDRQCEPAALLMAISARRRSSEKAGFPQCSANQLASGLLRE